MNTLKDEISTRLPRALRLPSRRLARFCRQCAGLPFSSLRRGSVAMLHIGRSGSTVLGNLLNQHPKIFWDSEIYYKKWEFDRFQPRDFDASRFIKHQMWTAGSRYYGFEVKILPDQHLSIVHMDLPEFVEHLKGVGVTHYILLERENLLRRMISQYVGTKTGRRQLQSGSEARLETVRLDVDALGFGTLEKRRPLLDCFAEMEQSYRRLPQLLSGENFLHLRYESDILADGPGAAYEKVCRFLDVEPLPVDVVNARTNPFRIREIVENYDELEATLAGTPYEWMLDDRREAGDDDREPDRREAKE